MQFIIGLLLAILISYTAWRVHSLSWDGALAAAFLGTVVFGLGGWKWASLLLIFFISSSVLTYTFKNRKRPLMEEYSKGGQRDSGQVLGNGGIAAIFVLVHLMFNHANWPWLAYAGALAAVNADTWATELGFLDSNRPRLITNLKQEVDKGTSGGISSIGTLAAFLGSAAIGIPAVIFLNSGTLIMGAFIILGGLLGSLFDSLLGATVQCMYYCPKDSRETEKHPLHTCGTPTIHKRGWKWLTNDSVNMACSAFGALIVLVLAIFPH